MKGRPRKSDAEKKAIGTFRKDRANDAAPISPQVQSANPVFKLDTVAKKIWKKTVKFLNENNLMGEVDLDMLTIYCNEMGMYIELAKKMQQAEKDIQNTRKHMEQEGALPMDIAFAIKQLPSPYAYLKMSHESMEKALKISDRFGFTPHARQKLKAEKPVEESDPILAMMKPSFQSKITAKA
jgi:P27 family predicted phage terminase small subunit